MVTAELHQRLKYLLDNWQSLVGDDISSPKGQQWIINVTSALNKMNPSYGSAFENDAMKVILPLSTYTREPYWDHMMYLLRKAVTLTEFASSSSGASFFDKGESYDLYKEINAIVTKAKDNVLFVDAYLDERFFDLYISSACYSRILTASINAKMRAVIDLAKRDTKYRFDLRISSSIHDRVIIVDNENIYVIGQSLKDAATKKSTYLVKVDLPDMIKSYNSLWENANNI